MPYSEHVQKIVLQSVEEEIERNQDFFANLQRSQQRLLLVFIKIKLTIRCYHNSFSSSCSGQFSQPDHYSPRNTTHATPSQSLANLVTIQLQVQYPFSIPNNQWSSNASSADASQQPRFKKEELTPPKNNISCKKSIPI